MKFGISPCMSFDVSVERVAICIIPMSERSQRKLWGVGSSPLPRFDRRKMDFEKNLYVNASEYMNVYSRANVRAYMSKGVE